MEEKTFPPSISAFFIYGCAASGGGGGDSAGGAGGSGRPTSILIEYTTKQVIGLNVGNSSNPISMIINTYQSAQLLSINEIWQNITGGLKIGETLTLEPQEFVLSVVVGQMIQSNSEKKFIANATPDLGPESVYAIDSRRDMTSPSLSHQSTESLLEDVIRL